jgi:segregation and condensation protein B
MSEKPALADQMRKLEQAFEAPLDQALARAEGRGGAFAAAVRAAEALLFASGEAMSAADLAALLPAETDVAAVLDRLQRDYAARGINLARVGAVWRFQSAADLAPLFTRTRPAPKRLSKAALECLGIIAYHQPVTRAEIEDIRGVMLSKGTLDVLMEIGWVKIRGRKKTPGRPVTFGTTEAFLVQFGLENIGHLPGTDELKAAGFLEAIPPSGFEVPNPTDMLGPDEDPYIEGEEPDLATGSADPMSA